MKTLGLIGGTTWVSTIDYYRLINQKTNELLGGLNSAKILLYSVNFEEFRPPVDPSDWEELTAKFTAIAQKLEHDGADGIVFCANTPHLIAEGVRQKLGIPLIHIAEAAAEEIASRNIKKVVLLGTRITMEQDFFKNKLIEKQIEVLIPGPEDRQLIHNAIFEEFGKDIFTAKTKAEFLRIINGLIEQGGEGVILGCTEFPHLIKPEDCSVPLFDTTVLHANAAVKFALG
ncbi:aspartate/glutamate racemase family protein [Mucilaginibacter gotjawali]|uniref:Aspartate racemase n=2 Tax=Mucilaginibacter gotjawali TaxID=1550579 RepID=A0A839SG82_9SPHI|nr:amino acid racemase [Mucilaginibacter gotjawali]MBB3056284.1 aspartate racemase [Mucilaginibacter gotjawali]BAU54988.1 putative amino-acid racemase [Mucilaginibacter gotjawali]